MFQEICVYDYVCCAVISIVHILDKTDCVTQSVLSKICTIDTSYITWYKSEAARVANRVSFVNWKSDLCHWSAVFNVEDVTIHWCIAMHQYFISTMSIDMADLVYHDSHETIYTGILEKDESKHTLFWSDWWWKCSDITLQSHILVQPVAVVVVGATSTGVAGCARCFWSQVSLLSCYTRCPSGILPCV